MFQIVPALALKVPAFLQNIENNYPVNHGDTWTTVVGVVNASHQIVGVLIFMTCLACPGNVYLCRTEGRR